LAVAVLHGQEPGSRPPTESPKSPADAGKARNGSLDGTKLPPGTIIIVTDKPADALRYANAVVLSPEEYKKLLEAAEAAPRGASDRAETPSACHLRGRVETRGAAEV